MTVKSSRSGKIVLADHYGNAGTAIRSSGVSKAFAAPADFVAGAQVTLGAYERIMKGLPGTSKVEF